MAVNAFNDIVQLIDQRFDELLQRIDCMERNSEARMREYANQLLESDSPYLTREEAAKVLRCSLSTIDNYRRTGKLPRSKLGGSQGKKILFLRDDVLRLKDV